MSQASALNAVIYQAKIDLTETIPLHVYLVKGANYAVWIDTGIKPMFPLLQETMALANVPPSDLRFILHTHSHHDHIGCNGQVKALTGCLIAAHRAYAAWHSDFEQHYQQFARAIPALIPDTPELRDEALGALDTPAPLDIQLTDSGATFDLGGGVILSSLWLPGHMLAEFGWFELSTRTLILGDAVTGLDWSLYHSHLTVQGYRDSLTRLRAALAAESPLQISQVVFAHFPPMTPPQALALIDKADEYIDGIEVALIQHLARERVVSLEALWTELCQRFEKRQEFRALNMTAAHMADLAARGIVRETAPMQYQLR